MAFCLIPYKNEASTLTVAKAYCTSLGYKLRSDKEWNEYHLTGNVDGAPFSYPTEDLGDAIGTAKYYHEQAWHQAMMCETADTDCAPVTPRWPMVAPSDY